MHESMSRTANELGLDAEKILAMSHGRRSMDILKVLAPQRANWECMFGTPFLLSSSLSHHPLFILFFCASTEWEIYGYG